MMDDYPRFHACEVDVLPSIDRWAQWCVGFNFAGPETGEYMAIVVVTVDGEQFVSTHPLTG